MTRSIYNGGIGDYEMKIQKYAITNPAFALALITTYAVASAGAANSGRSMTYNSYNSTFYINGVEAGTGVFEKIQKFNISGANFVAGAFTSYDEFMYFGTACTESNYSICNLEFPDASSYTIFVTQFMKEDWYTGTSSRKGIAYWLTTYQYPIF